MQTLWVGNSVVGLSCNSTYGVWDHFFLFFFAYLKKETLGDFHIHPKPDDCKRDEDVVSAVSTDEMNAGSAILTIQVH